MASKPINALAKRGLEIKDEIAKLTNELAGINSKLVKHPGLTIDLDSGRVLITQPTTTRLSGTYDLIFDKMKFLELDPDSDVRRAAMAAGIVRLEPGSIGGRDSVVQYSLKKAL
jgi:hypothetical protein